jgi:hypothetical protein
LEEPELVELKLPVEQVDFHTRHQERTDKQVHWDKVEMEE